VELHPTFKDPICSLIEQPFELQQQGWGVFPLKVTVQWIGGHVPTCLTWMLQLDAADASRKAYLPMPVWRYYERLRMEADAKEEAKEEEPLCRVLEEGGPCEVCGGLKNIGLEIVGPNGEPPCFCGMDLSHDYRVYGCMKCKGLRSPQCRNSSCRLHTCRCH